MDTLDQIAQRYGSDNGPIFHNYTSVLEPYFEPLRYKPIKFLELGVLAGQSLKTWHDYFPRGVIYGVDIENREIPDIGSFSRAEIIVGDATRKEILQRLPVTFDVVFDDASHISDQIMTSFNIFWWKLNWGGLYIISDLHSPHAAMARLQLMALCREFNMDEGQCADLKTADCRFEYIHFYRSMVIMKKRR